MVGSLTDVHERGASGHPGKLPQPRLLRETLYSGNFKLQFLICYRYEKSGIFFFAPHIYCSIYYINSHIWQTYLKLYCQLGIGICNNTTPVYTRQGIKDKVPVTINFVLESARICDCKWQQLKTQLLRSSVL